MAAKLVEAPLPRGASRRGRRRHRRDRRGRRVRASLSASVRTRTQRRRLLAGLLATTLTSLLLAGCGSSYPRLAALRPLRAVDDLAGPAWRSVAGSLTAKLHPASPNVCAREAQACMNAVVGEMTRRFDALAASCSHLAPFLMMYRQVSEEVAASARARRYEEPAYVVHLDAVFATYYFHAFDAWRAGRRSEVPGAWQVAFSAGEQRRVSTLGDLLLGMNAHISRDLPYAIATVGLRHANGTDATSDVTAINADIARAQAPALQMIATRFDSSIAILPKIAGAFVDPRAVGSLIAAWRLEALTNARRLLAARSRYALERVETTIDENAAIRALLILRATSYGDPAQATLARDGQCRREQAHSATSRR